MINNRAKKVEDWSCEYEKWVNACQKGKIKDLHQLSIKRLQDYCEFTAKVLLEAIENDNLEAVIFLEREGANLNYQNNLPIKVAVKKENIEILNYLITNGANIEVAIQEAKILNKYNIIDILNTWYSYECNKGSDKEIINNTI